MVQQTALLFSHALGGTLCLSLLLGWGCADFGQRLHRFDEMRPTDTVIDDHDCGDRDPDNDSDAHNISIGAASACGWHKGDALLRVPGGDAVQGPVRFQYLKCCSRWTPPSP
jgi:hypothetical protein